RAEGLHSAGFPDGCALSRARGQVASAPAPAASNRACGSPAHGSPTPFTAGIRLVPPGLSRPGRDGDPVQADQAELIRGQGDQRPPPEAAAAAVLLADEQREPHPRILPDRAEPPGRMAVLEV